MMWSRPYATTLLTFRPCWTCWLSERLTSASPSIGRRPFRYWPQSFANTGSKESLKASRLAGLLNQPAKDRHAGIGSEADLRGAAERA